MKKGLGVKMKPSGIGGMAVMEGVMMKNKDTYAVAVRKPDNEIAVEKSSYKDFSDKVKLFKLPIFRGMLAFVDSLVIGMKVLSYSASFFEEDESQAGKKKEASGKADRKKTAKKDATSGTEKMSAEGSNGENVENADADSAKKESEAAKKDEKSNALLMIFAVLISIVLSVSLFMVLPVFITGLVARLTDNSFLLTLLEGIIRLGIFIGYVVLAALMPDIKRVFMYHGAEHKTINCLENGFELTVENVRWQSKEHKRCGTSFMLLVILISLILFLLIPVDTLLWRVLTRILLVPFIAGISYEVIRLAGKSDNKVINIISKPGLWMQALTTKEPDDSMIEVAIQSVDAVFDWREFLKKYEAENTATRKASVKKPAPVRQSATKEKTNPQEQVNTETAAASTKVSGVYEAGKRNKGVAPIPFKPVEPAQLDEEDDEILKALDKFFDDRQKEQGKTGK